MECWQCGAQLEILAHGKVPCRMTCEKCHAWIHCCVNCKNYQPGLPNDCKVPGTDPIRDREASNFCEEFVIQGQRLNRRGNKDFSAIEKSLFKEENQSVDSTDSMTPEERFKKLFGE